MYAVKSHSMAASISTTCNVRADQPLFMKSSTSSNREMATNAKLADRRKCAANSKSESTVGSRSKIVKSASVRYRLTQLIDVDQ